MWELVTSIVLKLGEFIFKFGERPKVSIEANEFHYDCLNDNNDSSIVVITPYPSRYYANLVFSNVGRRLTTIKQITVLINGELKLPPSTFEPIRLEPGESCEEFVTFPVPESSALTQGTFEIKVVDAFGNKFKCNGHFPLSKVDELQKQHALTANLRMRRPLAKFVYNKPHGRRGKT